MEAGKLVRRNRTVLNLFKPRANLEVQANFLSMRVVGIWHEIPHKVKISKNPGQFTRLYKAHRCSLRGQ
jgi:hypothetical protein